MSIFRNIVLLMVSVVTSACCNCPTVSVAHDMGVITEKRSHIHHRRRYIVMTPYREYRIKIQQQSFRVPRDTFDKYNEGDHYYKYKVVCHHIDTCIYSSNYRKR